MRKEIPYLKTAIPEPGYKIYMVFEDGVSGIVDLHDWKGKGVFAYWNNEENFKNFRITDNKKIEWNEAIDMDPDSFYLLLIGKTFFEYAGN